MIYYKLEIEDLNRTYMNEKIAVQEYANNLKVGRPVKLYMCLNFINPISGEYMFTETLLADSKVG